MTSYRAKQQGSALLAYMLAHPDRTIDEIRSWLRKSFGYSMLEPHYLINMVRNKWGDEAVVCAYSYRRMAYVYRLAGSLAEVYVYTRTRTITVRQHISNIIGIIDRGEIKFAGEDATKIAQLRTSLIEAADALERGTA